MQTRDGAALAEHVLGAAPCCVALPAGCGKTEIVAAVAAEATARSQRVLLLTHTNAGLDALRERLRHFEVQRRDVMLATIASWTSRLARAFPRSAGIDAGAEPTWGALCDGAAHALLNPHVARMVMSSYGLVVVDEYQDCSLAQHRVLLALNELRPVIAFGDELQAIYDFGADDLVDLSGDLAPLSRLELPAVAWRWSKTNAPLGEYLLQARERLLTGNPIDLRDQALTWVEDSADNRLRLMRQLQRGDGRSVILTMFDPQCEAIAKTSSGRFQVMEDVDGRRLHPLAELVESSEGVKAAGELLALAKSTLTKLPASVTNKTKALRSGTFPGFKESSRGGDALLALAAFAEAVDASTLLRAMEELESLGDAVCRRETWNDLRRAATAWGEGADSLAIAIRAVRDRRRLAGRRAPNRSVSRPVLVKGHEFDHCVVADAATMNRRELYVAMTRGRTTLSILSAEPLLDPAP